MTIQKHLMAGGHLWLFLDYDGTLVPITRTPDEALPDAELLATLTTLVQFPQIRLTILSGRSLACLRKRLPVPGLILVGTHGLEIQYPNSLVVLRVELAEVRPTIERVLFAWTDLVAAREGFLLEDKGVALALHAWQARPEDALVLLRQAKAIASQVLDRAQFQFLVGDHFLEVAPRSANKGESVAWLLDEELPFHGVLVYLGDENNDEEAFHVVWRRGGIPILVGGQHNATRALARLPSTTSVRQWLQLLLEAMLPSHRLPPLFGPSPQLPSHG